MTQTEQVAVGQEDREAFIALTRISGGPPVDLSFVAMGQADDHPGVQAFARHRLNAVNHHQALVEALRDHPAMHESETPVAFIARVEAWTDNVRSLLGEIGGAA